jgi:hypothetical protein
MRKESSTDKNLLAELGYETRDIDIGKSLVGVVGLFVFVAVACGATIVLFNFLKPPYTEYERPAFAAKRKLPPLPQIQHWPKEEMRYYQQATDESVEASSIEKAKEEMIASGISGVKSSRASEGPKSYPGSGKYEKPGEVR